MTFVLSRLREPSTYAGIAAFLASFGLLGFTEADWTEVFAGVAAVFSAVAVFLGEKENE